MEIPVCHVAHATPSRTRLSFPNLKGRDGALGEICAALCSLPGVAGAEGRPLTGSVIVAHDGSAEHLLAAGTAAGLFDVRAPDPGPDPLAEAAAWKDWADSTLRETVGRGVDLRAIAAFAFIAIALRQLAAGSLLPPAATALWYGVSLMLAVNPEPGLQQPEHAGADGE